MKKDDDKKVSVKRKSVSKKKSVETDNYLSVDNYPSAEKDNPSAETENQSVKMDNDSSIYDNKGLFGLIGSKGLLGYLDKFRSKIIVTLIIFVILIPIGFSFSDIMLDYATKPFLATGNKLNIFTLAGGFMLKFKIAAAASFFVLIPLIIYQIWSVFSSLMPKSSKLLSGITIVISVLLFYGGVAFTFFFFLPMVIDIMVGFIHSYFKTTIGADSYLSFIIFFSLAMGFICETPLIIFVLTRMRIITPEMLGSKRKYAFIIIWIIAAIITPPDVVSQAIVALPLMIIFEISILISKLVVRRRDKKSEKSSPQGGISAA